MELESSELSQPAGGKGKEVMEAPTDAPFIHDVTFRHGHEMPSQHAETAFPRVSNSRINQFMALSPLIYANLLANFELGTT